VQVVHPDDVASAVMLAVTGALDGVYNLAAEGWMTAEACDALQGRARVPALPAELLERLLARAWRSGFGTVPPEVVPYLEHPWIVATDRVVAAGWRPSVSNEEAILEALDAVPAPRLDRRVPIAAAVVAGGLLAGFALRRRGRG
jgi:nucleoside-diphosphate-sugar epimerase